MAWEQVDPRVAAFGVTVMARALSAYAGLQGMNILASGPARFSNSSYSTALAMPGAPESWGLVLASAGALAMWGMTFHKRRCLVLGMFVQGAWSAFFSLTFLVAWMKSPTAGSTAHFAYAIISLMCFHVVAQHIVTHAHPEESPRVP